jgi:hypothetical protein
MPTVRPLQTFHPPSASEATSEQPLGACKAYSPATQHATCDPQSTECAQVIPLHHAMSRALLAGTPSAPVRHEPEGNQRRGWMTKAHIAIGTGKGIPQKPPAGKHEQPAEPVAAPGRGGKKRRKSRETFAAEGGDNRSETTGGGVDPGQAVAVARAEHGNMGKAGMSRGVSAFTPQLEGNSEGMGTGTMDGPGNNCADTTAPGSPIKRRVKSKHTGAVGGQTRHGDWRGAPKHATATMTAVEGGACAAARMRDAAANADGIGHHDLNNASCGQELRIKEAGAELERRDERRRKGDEELQMQLRLAMMASQVDTEQGGASLLDAVGAHSMAAGVVGGSGKHGMGAEVDQSGQFCRFGGQGSARGAPAHIGWLLWAEVFCGGAADGGWVHADPLVGLVNCAERVEAQQRAGPVITYVVAFYAGAAKDVTRRYCGSFMKSLKHRDEKWWLALLEPLHKLHVPGLTAQLALANGASAHLAPDTRASNDCHSQVESRWEYTADGSASLLAQLADRREEAELEQRALQERRELPQTIEGFKRSCVYVLERHITRYQGLEPGTKRLGLHRGESYYDRARLSDLHSADRWRREGREVMAAERATPAKTVKPRAAKGATRKDPVAPGEAPEVHFPVHGRLRSVGQSRTSAL